MRVPCDVELSVRFHCVCGASVETRYALPHYGEIPFLVPPPGWHIYDGVPHCPKHTLIEEDSNG